MLIDFDVSEALLALGAIQDKALESSRIAAISTGDEHEIADLSAKLLQRVATRITDALYPVPVALDEHGDGSECTNACHDPRCIRVHGHFPDSDHSDGVTNWPLPELEAMTTFAAMRRA